MKKDGQQITKKITPHHHRHFSRILVLPNLFLWEPHPWPLLQTLLRTHLYGLRLLPFLGRLRPGSPWFNEKWRQKPRRFIIVYLKNYNFLHSAGCGSSLSFNFQLRNEVMIHLLHFHVILFPYSKWIPNTYTTAIIG